MTTTSTSFYSLRPPALDQLGLIGAVRAQADELTAAAGVETTVVGPDLFLPLPAAAEVAALFASDPRQAGASVSQPDSPASLPRPARLPSPISSPISLTGSGRCWI